jgi:uncharacterized protein
VTRLKVAGLLHEPAGTSRTVDLGPLHWIDPVAPDRRHLLGSLRLQRTNRGVLVTGRARTMARRTCIRCLDDFDEPVDVTLNEEFLPSVDLATGATLVIDSDGVEVSRIDSHHEMDLGPILVEELGLAEPMHPLCRPDCRGLCPICGRRLEEGACEHADAEIDPRLAKLADWEPPAE